MNFHSSHFDLAIVSGPRITQWPLPGVQSLSQVVTDFGLQVAWVGGDGLNAKGVIPDPNTGGIVIAEDEQSRVHRIRARSIVKWNFPNELPDPFLGMFSPGLLTGTIAQRLLKSKEMNWNPGVAILGSSNQALRLGSQLLESGYREITLIEQFDQWEGKRYSGWEVEKRRFESLGGELIEATPLSLKQKSSWVWELRVQDPKGVRLLDVSRVVSFGPFSNRKYFREYPPGSLLFEFDQDIYGWGYSESAASYLGTKIVKALLPEVGKSRTHLESLVHKNRSYLKRIHRYREEPFSPSFQGKWLSTSTLQYLKNFSGVPQILHTKKDVASIECVECIGCNLCEQVCPTQAIQIEVSQPLHLNESACISCGLCLNVCPSATPVMLSEKEGESMSRLTLPMRGEESYSTNENVVLMNRRGETLGTGRVLEIKTLEIPKKEKAPPESTHFFYHSQVCVVEVPVHLLWEARAIKKLKMNSAIDQEFLKTEHKNKDFSDRIEIFVNGEKRRIREKIKLTQAFFETGQSRMEDRLDCRDGSCGLCEVEVDGIKSLACQVDTRKGMSIKIPPQATEMKEGLEDSSDLLCHCLGLTGSDLFGKVKQGKLSTIEAVLSSTHLGQGKCHGQNCMEITKRKLTLLGIPTEDFIDWRFPWEDWTIRIDVE